MPICSYCKKYIDENKDKAIYISKKNKNIWIHYDCYIQKYVNMKKAKPLKEIEKDADENYRSTLAYLKEKKYKDELYRFIQSLYNVVVLPKYFFIKMDSIFKGTYKGLSKGIPAEHLLDMWRRKQKYLLQTYANNCSKGKELDGIGRINYDLAILLNSYDRYLKWRTDIEAQTEQEHIIIKKQMIPKVKTNIIPDNKASFDIDKEIDEL